MATISTKPSSRQTYAIAHSARCKLGMATETPGRNLRFVLGHAFTLDKALFRVAEIEGLTDIEPQTAKSALQAEDDPKRSTEQQEGQTGSFAGGAVKFDDDGTRPSSTKTKTDGRQKKETRRPIQIPKPRADLKLDDDELNDRPIPEPELEPESDEEEQPVYSDIESDDSNNDNSLSLTRFASASAKPPRMIPSSEDDSDEDEEPASPPSLPTDFDIQHLMEGEQNGDLNALYESVRGCPCHNHRDIKCQGMWEVKGLDDLGMGGGRRLAVMKVDA